MDTTRYGLPTKTTIENLEGRYNHVIPYGENEVIVAGEFWQGYGRPGFYAAIYTYLEESDIHEPDDLMEITYSISGIEFDDAGHAIEWGIEQIKRMY